MEYINMPLRGFRSSEYIEATIKQRGIWISLLVWCCQQKNGGIIDGCRAWGDRQWMQACGAMASEVAESCGLYRWDGDDLLVFFYPGVVHQEVKKNLG